MKNSECESFFLQAVKLYNVKCIHLLIYYLISFIRRTCNTNNQLKNIHIGYMCF